MSVMNAEEKSTYLSFSLAEDIFALEVGYVREVLDMVELTRIPRMPEYMRGVINLRGSVVPVVDMRCKFGMERIENTVDTSIIVAEVTLCGQPAEVGVLVDSVQAVCEIKEEDIEPPPSIGINLNSNHIRGMGKVEDGFIIILNLDRIFAEEDLSMMTDVSGSEPAGEGVSLELG